MELSHKIFTNSNLLFLNKKHIIIKEPKNDKSQIITLNNNFEKIWDFEIDKPTHQIIKYNDSGFIVFENMESIFFDFEGNLLKKEPYFYYKHDIDNIIYVDLSEKEFIKFKNNDIKIKSIIGQKIFLKNYFIQNKYKEKSISCLSLIDNSQWQHNYTDLLGSNKAFLHSDIIKLEGKIYFFLSGTPNNKTFCIDIETGKIEHTYKDLIMFSIPEGNLLYNLHNNKLNILNTLTQEIETIDFDEELKKSKIHTDSKFVVQNGLIFFTQSMGDIVSKVGILSPKEKKLLWKYEFPKGSGQVGSLQVQGDRIYVHTQDKTLHIFEKE